MCVYSVSCLLSVIENIRALNRRFLENRSIAFPVIWQKCVYNTLTVSRKNGVRWRRNNTLASDIESEAFNVKNMENINNNCWQKNRSRSLHKNHEFIDFKQFLLKGCECQSPIDGLYYRCTFLEFVNYLPWIEKLSFLPIPCWISQIWIG